MENATVIILAGGKSRRMGKNKAFLSLEKGTCLANLVGVAKRIAKKCIIVADDSANYQEFSKYLTIDLRQGHGPLAGLEAGLLASTHEKNLLLACDMPFVTANFGTKLLQLLHADTDAVVPKINSRIQPLFAVYRKSTQAKIKKVLDGGNKRMIDFLNEINVIYPDEKVLKLDDFNLFYNMNTPEEYAYVKQFFKKSMENQVEK